MSNSPFSIFGNTLVKYMAGPKLTHQDPGSVGCDTNAISNWLGESTYE